MSGYEDFDDRLEEADVALAGTAGMVGLVNIELQRINQTFASTSDGVGKLDRALGAGLSKAIDAVVLDGAKMSEALGLVRESLSNAAWKAAKEPVVNHASGLLSGLLGGLFGSASPFADGAGFAQGRVMPFANGGVVSGPVTFPMRGGTGLMGEAGPEAIMPLSRGADGKLGVRAAGGSQPVQVVMNIQTPDVQGFQRSQSQIAAQMARALGAGARNR